MRLIPIPKLKKSKKKRRGQSLIDCLSRKTHFMHRKRVMLMRRESRSLLARPKLQSSHEVIATSVKRLPNHYDSNNLKKNQFIVK